MSDTIVSVEQRVGAAEDRGYGDLLRQVRGRFSVALTEGPLFRTDAAGLYEKYLGSLSLEHRQHHTCTACRRFIEAYGGLVVVDDHGNVRSAVWRDDPADPTPTYYRPAVDALERAVLRANITGVFRSAEATLGQPLTGPWTHFSVELPAAIRHTDALYTPGQVEAAKLEEHGMVGRAMLDFESSTVETALRLLDSDALYRSEKVIGPIRWFRDILTAERTEPNRRTRLNRLWRAVALAPAGFCHVRSAMAGSLLEDIQSGLPYEEVSRRFAAKMHPLQYRRPQVAPSAGTVRRAEEIFERLGLASALKRRYARLDEVEAVWRPTAPAEPAKPPGIFGHLTVKEATPEPRELTIPAITLTYEKFARTVLVTADAIDYWVPDRRAHYAAITTAVDPDAPPLLQWDQPDRRNPASSYTYHEGTLPTNWGLSANRWCSVAAVVANPAHWLGNDALHHTHLRLFLLEGARDSGWERCGIALFPETIRSELNEVRSVIEAYSRQGQLEGSAESSACGITLVAGGRYDERFRVTTRGVRQEYRIDRWD